MQLSLAYRGPALWNNTLANDYQYSIVDATCKSLEPQLEDSLQDLNILILILGQFLPQFLKMKILFIFRCKFYVISM